jgi:hypothetical protein
MDALFQTYVNDRIEYDSDYTLSTKISVINDDFKDWYWSIHGDRNGCAHVMKDLKAYLETRYGKYPSNGWKMIKISEEESKPVITEELKVIHQINIKMEEVNKLMKELVKLQMLECKTEMLVMKADLDFYKEKYLASIKTNNNCIKCKKTYTDCVCFDGN